MQSPFNPLSACLFLSLEAEVVWFGRGDWALALIQPTCYGRYLGTSVTEALFQQLGWQEHSLGCAVPVLHRPGQSILPSGWPTAKALVLGSPTICQRSHDTAFWVQKQQTSWYFKWPYCTPFHYSCQYAYLLLALIACYLRVHLPCLSVLKHLKNDMMPKWQKQKGNDSNICPSVVMFSCNYVFSWLWHYSAAQISAVTWWASRHMEARLMTLSPPVSPKGSWQGRCPWRRVSLQTEAIMLILGAELAWCHPPPSFHSLLFLFFS